MLIALMARRRDVTERETIQEGTGAEPDGPRVGLASYELRDPEATFRIIEPFRPRPEPRPPGPGSWLLRFLLVYAVNLVALAGAGLLLTAVGPSDPFAYAAWAVVFAAANASPPVLARLVPRPRAVLVAAAFLLVVDVALVWLMTLLVRPFHSPDLAAYAKAGAAMWVANLPLAALYLKRRRELRAA
jgi:hypothetical protein